MVDGHGAADADACAHADAAPGPLAATTTRTLVALIIGQICLHSCMTGVRLAGPLQVLRQSHSAWEVGVLLGLFAAAPVLLALHAGTWRTAMATTGPCRWRWR